MALYGSFAVGNHFSELDSPFDNGQGTVMTPAQRRAAAMANLVTGVLDFPGPAGTGAASAGVLTFNTVEPTVVITDQLGRIDFKAGSEASGTDAILVGASIWAEAENTFSATVNETSLVFATGASEAATEKMRLKSNGVLDIGGLTQDVVVVTDAASYAVLAANSGKLHVIPNLTADTVITLPTAAAGLRYKFMYGGVAADAQDWIIKTGSDTNFYLGGVIHLDTDAGAGADEIVPVYPNGSTNSMLDFDTPQAGTWVELWCNGTNWFLNGHCVGVTAPTFANNA